jgi:hypothetical protein
MKELWFAPGTRIEICDRGCRCELHPAMSDRSSRYEVFCPSALLRLRSTRHGVGKGYPIDEGHMTQIEPQNAFQDTVLSVVVHNAFPGADIED